MDIYIENDENFYNTIKKQINKNNTIHFKYNNQDITNEKDIDLNKLSKDIKFKVYTVTAINIKDIKKRYSYIYDVVCNYLDNEFTINNLCDFENNKCISVRNKSHCSESVNGCCYGRNRGLCKHFKNNTCSIKSISCKLFTCRYLRKKGVKFKINDIVLLKYFFNFKQKLILNNSIFKDKKEIINLLLESRNLI